AVTAEKASAALEALFRQALSDQHGDPSKALRQTVAALADLTENDEAGSTASIVYVPAEAEQAWAAVLGDSPVWMLDRAGRLHQGPLHNVRENPRELAAAMARGAIYQDGYIQDPQGSQTGLQMSRCL